MNEPRKLSPFESGIIAAMLSHDFQGRNELKAQLSSATAIDYADKDNYGSIQLIISSDIVAHVADRVAAELTAKDVDGVPIEALLHVVDGKACELEFYKADGTPIQSMPSPEDFVHKEW